MRIKRNYLGGFLSHFPVKPGRSMGSQAKGGGLAGRAPILPYDAIPLTGRNGWINLLRLWNSDGFQRSHLVMVRNFERLGPVYRERIGNQESLYIFLPEDVATLVKAEGTTPRRMSIASWVAHRELRSYVLGVFLKNGDEWRTARIALNKEVAAPLAVAGFTPLLDSVARDFVAMVRRLQPGSWDLQTQLFRFSLEASCHALYGRRLGLLETENCPEAERFLQAVKVMLKTTFPILFLPVPLLKYLNTKLWRDHVAAWDTIFQYGTYLKLIQSLALSPLHSWDSELTVQAHPPAHRWG
eukprot:gi/632989528/ref/XP_007883696.1/ PREDICTED: cytochrome P450 11B, mitochondrial-like [Callorhinchus milii]